MSRFKHRIFKALLKYLKFVTERELMPGVVALIQTFGDRINFHPHIHILAIEGGADPDGAFHHISRFHDERIRKIFTHEVFSLLLREKHIGLSLMQKILSWRHTGFNVHSKVRARDRKETERVDKYRIRPLLSLERLSFDERDAKVIYRYGKGAKEPERMDYLERVGKSTQTGIGGSHNRKPNSYQLIFLQ